MTLMPYIKEDVPPKTFSACPGTNEPRLARFGGGGYSLSQAPGAQRLAWPADPVSGRNESVGTKFSRLFDQLGNGNHAEQATDGDRPLNTRQVNGVTVADYTDRSRFMDWPTNSTPEILDAPFAIFVEGGYDNITAEDKKLFEAKRNTPSVTRHLLNQRDVMRTRLGQTGVAFDSFYNGDTNPHNFIATGFADGFGYLHRDGVLVGYEPDYVDNEIEQLRLGSQLNGYHGWAGFASGVAWTQADINNAGNFLTNLGNTHTDIAYFDWLRSIHASLRSTNKGFAPEDDSGVTINSGSGSIAMRDERTSIASAGLQGILSGNVYELNSDAGNVTKFRFAGGCANGNPHSIGCHIFIPSGQGLPDAVGNIKIQSSDNQYDITKTTEGEDTWVFIKYENDDHANVGAGDVFEVNLNASYQAYVAGNILIESTTLADPS